MARSVKYWIVILVLPQVCVWYNAFMQTVVRLCNSLPGPVRLCGSSRMKHFYPKEL